MDAVKYVKAKYRFCETFEGCSKGCPLNDLKDGECGQKKFAEEAVAIVEKWDKENPVKTYLSVLLEKLPNTILDKGVPETFCPNHIFKTNRPCHGKYFACTACWNREYKEDK